MAKWLLHSYLQVALNLPATRLSSFRPHPVSGYRKSLYETGKFRNNV